MDFATPPYPWAVFFCVLILVSLVNYMIASQSSPRKTCKEIWMICERIWRASYTWFKEKINWLEGVDTSWCTTHAQSIRSSRHIDFEANYPISMQSPVILHELSDEVLYNLQALQYLWMSFVNTRSWMALAAVHLREPAYSYRAQSFSYHDSFNTNVIYICCTKRCSHP